MAAFKGHGGSGVWLLSGALTLHSDTQVAVMQELYHLRSLYAEIEKPNLLMLLPVVLSSLYGCLMDAQQIRRPSVAQHHHRCESYRELYCRGEAGLQVKLMR
jgi:hypothetical protein